MDGLDLCKFIRQAKPDIPIIMLTALGTTDDKVEGFDAGADDYLVKPFEMRELLMWPGWRCHRDAGAVASPTKLGREAAPRCHQPHLRLMTLLRQRHIRNCCKAGNYGKNGQKIKGLDGFSRIFRFTGVSHRDHSKTLAQ